MVTAGQPFSLLQRMYGDPEMVDVLSEARTIDGWLAAEIALARAQATVGVMSREEAEAIAATAVLANVDVEALWREGRNVGYPILPLVRMVSARLPAEARGKLHYGATTQDIMDTGLVLQLKAALARLDALVHELGEALVAHVTAHRHTILAARTHAQQAVPTTFGSKLAVFVAQLARHRERLSAAERRACLVSLHGAGGTSAALGPHAARIRRHMAEQLGLGTAEVPWHVARDGLAEVALASAAVATTCSRLAREVIDLSRSEIAEVAEQNGHHRGASSTMPQKVNPVGSEAVVGLATAAAAAAGAMLRAIEAGHERAAGEWQIEWQVLPEVLALAAAALATAGEVTAGLEVHPDAMRRNLEASRGLVMAEAYMMRLAPRLGRERAHDLVYTAAQDARRDGSSLRDAVARQLARLDEREGEIGPLDPASYVGEPDAVCDAALAQWRRTEREVRRA